MRLEVEAVWSGAEYVATRIRAENRARGRADAGPAARQGKPGTPAFMDVRQEQ
jgi:hypothetical protein